MTPDELAEEYLDRGIEHHEAKRFAEAEAEYRAGLELAPENPYLYYNLASVFFLAGNLDAAIDHYREATRLSTGFFEPRYYLAMATAAQVHKHPTRDGWRQVRSLCLDALAIGPRNRYLLDALGRAEWFLGNRSGTIRLFREMAALDPDDLDALDSLARALQKTGQWHEMFKTTVALCSHPDYDNSEIWQRSLRFTLKSVAAIVTGLSICIYLKQRQR